MSKGETKSASVRVAKPKTPAQKAKAAANVALATRLAEERRQQQIADVEARRLAADKVAESQKMERAIEELRQSEQRYVTMALSGASASVLNRWLAGRDATFSRVKRFFDERPNLVQPMQVPTSKVG